MVRATAWSSVNWSVTCGCIVDGEIEGRQEGEGEREREREEDSQQSQHGQGCCWLPP